MDYSEALRGTTWASTAKTFKRDAMFLNHHLDVADVLLVEKPDDT
jgi:hypothetical protein